MYFVKDIKEGEVITTEHVKSIRPGYGLAPKFFDSVIGETVRISIKKGHPVSLELIKKVNQS